ncbi:MAG: hypothetical protein ACK5L8_12745 [Marinicella pacifica]
MKNFLLIYILLFSLPVEVFAICTISTNTATCSGNFLPIDLPVTYSANGDGVDTIILDQTVNASADTTDAFHLLNNDALLSADLLFNMQEGAMINRINGPAKDAVWIKNEGTGTDNINIEGTIISDVRGVRYQSQLSTSTGGNVTTVTENAVIQTGQTALWVRNQSLGYVDMNVAGLIEAADGRGIHISNNNNLSSQYINVSLSDTSRLWTFNQGVYVGNAGTGDVSIQLAGVLQGGNATAGTFAVSAALVLDAVAGGTIDIEPTGHVFSLNDLSIYDTASREAVSQINNQGTLFGYLELAGQDDIFINQANGSFNVRYFNDSNQDGVRETENVAIVDFGAQTDVFTNNNLSTIRLLTVPDNSDFTNDSSDNNSPTTFNTGATEYFPAGSAALPNSIDGIEQAHFVNLETFNHNGIITMSDMDTGGAIPVAGDTMVITASSNAGTSGSGNYHANGGSLHLDTVINDGLIDTTDVLIVDSTSLGTAPTLVTLTNAGGTGAFTGTGPNDGILLVEVLDSGNSDPGAFILDGGSIQVGSYLYELKQADGQNWYLQSGASSDISISKTLLSTGPFNAGDTVSYELKIINSGPDMANNIVITDTMTNLNFVSLSGGGCSPSSFPCSISSIANGASETILVSATITTVGSFNNEASAFAAEFDPNLTNNTDNVNNGGITEALQVPAYSKFSILLLLLSFTYILYRKLNTL